MPKKAVMVENSIWLAHDGYVDIDEDWQSEVDKLRWQDRDVKALIKDWRELRRQVIDARYNGIEAYAMLDRADQESYVFLKVCFFHPGPDMDTPLPRKTISSIKRRVKALIRIIEKKGFELEPMDWEELETNEELTQYWITLGTSQEFGSLLDLLVQLSIEFGLLEYLWQPVEV